MTVGPNGGGVVTAARDGLGPDDAAIARVRARVAVAVSAGAAGAGAGAVGAATAAPSAAVGATASAGATAGAFGVVKIVAAIAIVAAGATTGVVVATRGGDREVPAVVRPAAPAPTSAPRPIAGPERPAVVPESPLAGPSSPAPVRPAADVRPPPPDRPAPARAAVQPAVAPQRPPSGEVALVEPAPAPAPAPAAPALAREVELIDRAQSALRDDRPSDALDALATYTREVGAHGQLAREAAKLEVEAACRANAPDSADRLAALARRYPGAVTTRLRAACTR